MASWQFSHIRDRSIAEGESNNRGKTTTTPEALVPLAGRDISIYTHPPPNGVIYTSTWYCLAQFPRAFSDQRARGPQVFGCRLCINNSRQRARVGNSPGVIPHAARCIKSQLRRFSEVALSGGSRFKSRRLSRASSSNGNHTRARKSTRDTERGGGRKASAPSNAGGESNCTRCMQSHSFWLPKSEPSCLFFSPRRPPFLFPPTQKKKEDLSASSQKKRACKMPISPSLIVILHAGEVHSSSELAEGEKARHRCLAAARLSPTLRVERECSVSRIPWTRGIKRHIFRHISCCLFSDFQP